MAQNPISPAVIAFENERARAARQPQNELDRELENTFPASDPISISNATKSQGSPVSARSPLAGVSAPLVEQALETVRVRNNETAFGREELAALKEELLSLQVRAETAGIDLKDKAVNRFNDGLEQGRAAIQEKPLKAVAIAGAIGFLIGYTR